MRSYTFTTAMFCAFKTHVAACVGKLGVTGWKLETKHDQIGDGTCADVSFNITARKAIIRLTETVEYAYGITTDVEELALHEVMHLLLADLIWTATDTRDHCCDAVVAREHDVINRLLGVVK